MIKNSIFLHIISSVVLAVGFLSCTSQESDVDLSAVELEMKLERFDQALFTARSVDEVKALSESHPMFYPVYLFNIMPGGALLINKSAEDHAVELYKYIGHPDMGKLYDLVQEKFGDFEEYREALELAAKHINYYFPEEHIDRTVTYVSTFEYASVFLDDDKVFAIGLDMYMGRDFEVYPLLDASRFPGYRIRKLEPKYIVPNAVLSFLNYKVPRGNPQTFIDEAIYEGKKLYAMDKLLTGVKDSVKIAYANGQLEWCEDNAVNIWGYLVEKDILYSTDRNAYTNAFFNDAPFTTPFGNDSSPRVGAWLGWQMVRAYMERHPEVTLSELFADKDHQRIFTESKYKP